MRGVGKGNGAGNKGRRRRHPSSAGLVAAGDKDFEASAWLDVGLPTDWPEIMAGRLEVALRRLSRHQAERILDDAFRQADEARRPRPVDQHSPLVRLDLETRVIGYLESLGIYTVGELRRLDLERLREVPNFGPVYLEQVRRELARLAPRLEADA